VKPIKKLRAKIGVGERRLIHLRERVVKRLGTESGLEHDRAEVGFIEAAITALKYYETIRWPEISPVVALSALLDALDAAGIPNQTNGHDEIAVAVTKARRALKAIEGISS